MLTRIQMIQMVCLYERVMWKTFAYAIPHIAWTKDLSFLSWNCLQGPNYTSSKHLRIAMINTITKSKLEQE